MARNSILAEDLAALAGDERSRLGEPPTAEELIAYRDGKLTEQAAERVRDRLAADPEWAAIYLDLRSDAATLAAAAPAGTDVDEAWRALEARLEAPAVVPLRRRPAGRALLALAAALVVALGVIWLLLPAGPAGEFYRVDVTGASFRGTPLTVPRNFAGVEFYVDASAVAEEVVVALRDASGGVVREKVFRSERVVFRVPAAVLADGRAYRLTVRPPGDAMGDPAAIDEVFLLAFGD